MSKGKIVALALLMGALAHHEAGHAATSFPFDEPIDVLGPQILNAVGCESVDATGQTGAGKIYSCQGQDSNGLPATVEVMVFERNGASEAHAWMAWTDYPPGGPFVAPHSDRGGAEVVLRNLLGVLNVQNAAPISAAFFTSRVKRNDDTVFKFTRGDLRLYVELEDTNGAVDRRIFVGGPKFVLPQG